MSILFEDNHYASSTTKCKLFYRLLLLLLFAIFSWQPLLMVFHWGLSDSKSLQVTRTLLSILADLKTSVVWMVSIRPLISNYSNLFAKLLGTVPSTPITIGIIVTVISQAFLDLRQGRSTCLFFFFFFFRFL